ncbi:MAG: glycine oxidase ThiO [Dehalococcoidia bacterium]|jgi:glycine oxidase
MSSNGLYDVIVVGGGVIGCAVGYYLACEGVSVTVVERGEIGCEASSAAAGMLAPLTEVEDDGPFQEIAIAGLRLFPTLAETLRAESGVDIEYLTSGILRVASSEPEEQRLRSLTKRLVGLPLHWLSAEEARTLEPALSPEIRGALFSPEEHQVGADRLVRAFARAAAAHGAKLYRDCRVDGLLKQGERVVGVRTADGPMSAGHVIVAAGSWTGRLVRSLGVALPVFPVRGQMAALPGKSLLRHIVWGEDGYLVPKANGLVFAGATVENVGFRQQTTVAGIRGLVRMAGALAPRLAGASPVVCWAGLRPGSGDGLPLLGPLPGWEGVSVATGHYRNGILLSAITGRLIARSIIDGLADESMAPFSPARFGDALLNDAGKMPALRGKT